MEKYSQQVSRYLTDVVLTQIADDIRETYEPSEPPSMWNKSYFEARVPESLPCSSNCCLTKISPTCVTARPTIQIFVSRAIYKVF